MQNLTYPAVLAAATWWDGLFNAYSKND